VTDMIHNVGDTPLTEGIDFDYRYVAGISGNGQGPVYYVVRLAETKEQEPRRLASEFVISGLSREQVEHLWMQLGKAIGRREAFEDQS
jgi:hypothetical protein